MAAGAAMKRMGAILALIAGCSRDDYRPGDWEAVVDSPLPASAETMRVCVTGAPVTELGAGNGRAAVPGLLPAAASVRVEVLDEAGAQVLMTEWVEVGDEVPVVDLAVATADGSACEDDGSFAAEGEDSRLLVVRFEEA